MGARLQVHHRPAGRVARQRRAGERGVQDLLGEARQDHVDDGRLKRAAHEPSAHAVGREAAHAVGLHARLLEQLPVGGELPVGRVVGCGEREVVLDRPALGVLGVQRLVQRDAEAGQDRARLELAGGDLLARAEQLVGVEVDGARVDLDVAGVRQAGADQRPHRVQALQDRRPVIRQFLEDRVEFAALRARAVQLRDEQRRPGAGGGHQPVTARG